MSYYHQDERDKAAARVLYGTVAIACLFVILIAQIIEWVAPAIASGIDALIGWMLTGILLRFG